jgi:hypothetical protein
MSRDVGRVGIERIEGRERVEAVRLREAILPCTKKREVTLGGVRGGVNGRILFSCQVTYGFKDL